MVAGRQPAGLCSRAALRRHLRAAGRRERRRQRGAQADDRHAQRDRTRAEVRPTAPPSRRRPSAWPPCCSTRSPPAVVPRRASRADARSTSHPGLAGRRPSDRSHAEATSLQGDRGGAYRRHRDANPGRAPGGAQERSHEEQRPRGGDRGRDVCQAPPPATPAPATTKLRVGTARGQRVRRLLLAGMHAADRLAADLSALSLEPAPPRRPLGASIDSDLRRRRCLPRFRGADRRRSPRGIARDAVAPADRHRAAPEIDLDKGCS